MASVLRDTADVNFSATSINFFCTQRIQAAVVHNTCTGRIMKQRYFENSACKLDLVSLGSILEMRVRFTVYLERQESRHPCVQPSACNTSSDVVCSTHTMLSQVLSRHCDIVNAHRSVRNQLSRATAARPVTHIHHRASLFAACIIRNRYGDAPWHYATRRH